MLGTQLAVKDYQRRHRSALLHLAERSHWTHEHLDWTSLERWLNRGDGLLALAWNGDELAGCMGLSAAESGASWLRLLSLRDGLMASLVIDALWRALKRRCEAAGINSIMALSLSDWLPAYLGEQGFIALDELVALTLSLTELPDPPATPARIRAAEIEDLGRVAAIDRASFPAIWRMPFADLRDAWRAGADVKCAEIGGRMAGYSLCLRELDRGHIARLAAIPEARGKGIGAALLHRALRDFQRRGIATVGVNTQLGNLASQRLYQRFGFARCGPDIPILNARLARSGKAP